MIKNMGGALANTLSQITLMMFKKTHCLIVTTAVVLLMAFIIWILNAVGAPFACHNYVLRQVPSPDKHYIAQYYERECNATVGFNRQVKLVDAKDTLFSVKQMLNRLLPAIYDMIYGLEGTVLVVKGKAPLKLQWQNAKTLLIASDKPVQVYWKKLRWHKVQLRYALLTNSNG